MTASFQDREGGPQMQISAPDGAAHCSECGPAHITQPCDHVLALLPALALIAVEAVWVKSNPPNQDN